MINCSKRLEVSRKERDKKINNSKTTTKRLQMMLILIKFISNSEIEKNMKAK